jgi:hypothetical protein
MAHIPCHNPVVSQPLTFSYWLIVALLVIIWRTPHLSSGAASLSVMSRKTVMPARASAAIGSAQHLPNPAYDS